jgi:RecJ-like exonuclease
MNKCPTCLGKGSFFGLGMIEHKCDLCCGTGLIEDVEPAMCHQTEKKPIINDGLEIAKEPLTRSEKMKAAWVKRKAKNKDD